MANLKIYCDGEFDRFQEIADAVYFVLKQKINLFAELDIVSADEIKELNRDNRGVDSVTDVLSFPMLDGIRGKVVRKKDFPFDYDADEKAVFIGSIAICRERAAEQAEEYCHSLERELSYLFVHGLMHLFGYDHMTDEDKKQMREKEEAVLHSLGIDR